MCDHTSQKINSVLRPFLSIFAIDPSLMVGSLFGGFLFDLKASLILAGALPSARASSRAKGHHEGII